MDNRKHRVALFKDECEAALLEYVNKREGTSYKSASNIKIVNGNAVEDVLLTGLLFNLND